MTVVVTGFTAARMLEMEDATIIDGNVVGNDLILETKDGTTINAGNVRGIQGIPGPGYIICTSTTRPSSPAEGTPIYETNTKLVRVWDGTKWRCQERFICTNGTRPTLVSQDEGTKIYETDTDQEYIWNGSSFILPKPWNSAWGLLDLERSTTDTSSIASTTVDIANMSVAWTAVANRRYRTTVHIPRIQQSATGGAESIALLRTASGGGGSNVVPRSWSMFLSGSETTGFHFAEIEEGLSAGAKVRQLRMSCSAYTLSLNGSSYPGYIMVEDIGPNGNPV